jgi:hypothetical protein
MGEETKNKDSFFIDDKFLQVFTVKSSPDKVKLHPVYQGCLKPPQVQIWKKRNAGKG